MSERAFRCAGCGLFHWDLLGAVRLAHKNDLESIEYLYQCQPCGRTGWSRNPRVREGASRVARAPDVRKLVLHPRLFLDYRPRNPWCSEGAREFANRVRPVRVTWRSLRSWCASEGLLITTLALSELLEVRYQRALDHVAESLDTTTADAERFAWGSLQFGALRRVPRDLLSVRGPRRAWR